MFSNVKYAYFDLDGTLIPNNKTISEETIKAFQHLQSKGIKVGIATGRSPYFVVPYQDRIKTNLPFICINGSFVVDEKNNVLLERPFPKSANILFDYLVSHQIDFLVYAQEGVYFSDIKHMYYEKLSNMAKTIGFKINFDFKEVKDLDFFKNKKFLKILVSFKDENDKKKIEELVNKVDGITCASSQANVMDIFNSEADKAYGIEFVVKSFNGNNDEVIVFGDNENDIKMFQTFKNSVALKNAKPEVSKHAKFVTDLTCGENGVADFIFKNFK